jgi:tetratricopeptide (TPR) repeat protein
MRALLGLLFVLPLSFGNASAQEFGLTKITDHVYVVTNPEDEDQLVIASEKGLVVFDTFWSSITARKYKAEISRLLERNDFLYTVNMVDRLDMFGGNAAYEKTTIIGHLSFLDKYADKQAEVQAEIDRLIEMWRNKERISRERLPTHEKGSDAEKNEIRWMNTCRQRAEELEAGFSLLLPALLYNDRMTLDLGDVTLELIWFGRAGYDGMTVAVLPEEKLAIIPGFIMHGHHLAPFPFPGYAKLDVPRWIAVLEEILEGDDPVDRVACDINSVWSRERALTHLNYIRRLWNDVAAAEAAGQDLPEIQDRLSLDNEFAFVKEMQVYRDGGDDWIRPQHRFHVRLFFLQHKNPASEILRSDAGGSLQDRIAKVRKLREDGGDAYFEEASINALGYELLGSSRIPDAIDVFRLNVEVFPDSANVYDSLGEAYMKNGDSENAIANYERSLGLNPSNENARRMLETLKTGETEPE